MNILWVRFPGWGTNQRKMPPRQHTHSHLIKAEGGVDLLRLLHAFCLPAMARHLFALGRSRSLVVQRLSTFLRRIFCLMRRPRVCDAVRYSRAPTRPRTGSDTIAQSANATQ